MANNKYKNRNNPYAPKRTKVAKPKPQDNVNNEVRSHTKRNRIVVAAVLIVTAGLVLSMIYPYLVNQGSAKDFTPQTLESETNTTVTYTPSVILAGEALTRADQEYYVLLGDSESLSTAGSGYTGTLPIYTVNTDNPLNSSVTTDVSKAVAKPANASEIKVKDKVALLHVTNGVTTEFYQGTDAVTNKLTTK